MNIPHYSIRNMDEIMLDVEKRKQLIIKITNIANKVNAARNTYYKSLQQIASNQDWHRVKNPTKPTQFYYNGILNLFQSELQGLSQFYATYSKKIQQKLKQVLPKLNKNDGIKASINIYNQPLDNNKEEIRKIRQDLKTCRQQMIVFKEKHIFGLLTGIDSIENNTLHHDIQEKQKQINKLCELQAQTVKKYNQYIDRYGQKMKTFIHQISQKQRQKFIQIQKLFVLYKNYYSQLSSTLRYCSNSPQSPTKKVKKLDFDFVNYCEENYVQDIKKLKQQINKNASYMDKVYKNITNLGKYDNFYTYEEQLQYSNFFIDDVQDNLQMLEKNRKGSLKLHKARQRVTLYFLYIFQENDKDQEELKSLKCSFLEQLHQSDRNRKNLILCFRQFRKHHQFELPISRYSLIEQIMNNFLTYCQEQKDSYNCIQMLPFAHEFFFKKNNTDIKIYLHELFVRHPIWSDISLWEAGIIEGIYLKQVLKNPQKLIKAKQLKGFRIGAQSKEKKLIFQQNIFNQLIYYLNYMQIFDLSQPLIEEFCKKYIKIFKINKQNTIQLKNFIKQNFQHSIHLGSSSTTLTQKL